MGQRAPRRNDVANLWFDAGVVLNSPAQRESTSSPSLVKQGTGNRKAPGTFLFSARRSQSGGHPAPSLSQCRGPKISPLPLTLAAASPLAAAGVNSMFSLSNSTTSGVLGPGPDHWHRQRHSGRHRARSDPWSHLPVPVLPGTSLQDHLTQDPAWSVTRVPRDRSTGSVQHPVHARTCHEHALLQLQYSLVPSWERTNVRARRP